MTKLVGGFGGAGILAGVDGVVERHLGIADIGTSQPRFGHRSACLRLSGAPPANFDAAALMADVLDLIEANWRVAPTRKPSAENWRFDKQLWIADANSSAEKTLEKAIARLGGDAWANQVPTASGLVSSTNDRHRNLDLVFRAQTDCFEFIELKFHNNTPLYAAIESLLYGALYLASRLRRQVFDARARLLLDARAVHLRVLAPAAYYRGYRFDWLESALTRGLQRTIDGGSVLPEKMDFMFTAFPDDFRWPSTDDELLRSLENRGQVRWTT